jgi:hypothetical protein
VRGWAGSMIGTEGFLSGEPHVQHLELNEWFRFLTPGHFSLEATSTAVSRVKGANEGAGQEPLTLESNTLEFDVLPADPSWEAAELADIERGLNPSVETQERYAALHRLAILDTPASVTKVVELYLEAGPGGDPSGNLYKGLNNSARLDLIIELLERSLSNPTQNPHAIGADMLAELQVRKTLGVIPRRPTDLDEQKEWDQKLQERNKMYQDYFKRANDLLLVSLKKRTGPERVEALYEAWNNAERQNGGKPEAPDSLKALRLEVLNEANELGPGRQINFLYSEWPHLPHSQLRPILESVAKNTSKEAEPLREQAYNFWCQDWPRDCSAAILSDVVQPGTRLNENVILLLPEAEHPELDRTLEEELTDVEPPKDYAQPQRMSSLILRAGSRTLRPAVEGFLDRTGPGKGYSCDVQAQLIGYLFRFASKDAARRTLDETMNEKSHCGAEILRSLHRVRYSDDLIPVAVKALNSPNLNTAGSAALFLGVHGPASAQAELQRRLDALREEWRERAAEVRAAEGRFSEAGLAWQAAGLEKSLVSALVAGASWKLTPREQESLREGCLTEKCRDFADGKSSFGF